MDKKNVPFLRVRTIVLTLAIVLTITVYFLITVSWENEVNLIDLIFMGCLQIVIHLTYFPDGVLFAEIRDFAFIENRRLYNLKSSAITANKKFTELREYCEWEYEQRKNEYVADMCSTIGITPDELEILKKKSEKEINTLESFEVDGTIIFFDKHRRKLLYNLIFKPLPVEKNRAESILSATDINYEKAIKDTSIGYKRMENIKKIVKALVLSTFLAYIGFTFKGGITFAVIAKIAIYFTTILSTAVLSFSAGERCTKIYKNKYYIDLSNFIDSYFEWLLKYKQIEIKVDE